MSELTLKTKSTTMRNDIRNVGSGEQEKGGNTLKGYDHTRFSNDYRYTNMVREAAFYYDNMRGLRDKWRRDIDYYMGRQLNDTVVYNGRTLTVHDYMELKGMAALSNDIISDKMITMKGVVRQQYMSPTIKSVDAGESAYANLFNELLRQNDNNNDKSEHCADQFESHISLGFICDKVKWSFRQGREDVFIDAVDPFKLAVPVWENKDLSDVEFIAEAHDLSWPQLLKQFFRKPGDETKIAQIYTAAIQNQPIQGRNDTGMNQKDTTDGFLYPDTYGKYRYIEIWTKEYNYALWCHDRLNATAGYRPLSDKSAIDAENEQRKKDNIVVDENGAPMLDEEGNVQYYVDPDELQLIEYKKQIDELWYYRCLSPNGYLLDEGISPYKVLRDGYSFYYHPYVFLAYGFMNEVRSFEDRLIDKQRQFNHDCIMTDFILMNSAKNAMAIDVESISDMQSWEEMADQYIKVGGILLYTSKKGGNAPQAIANRSLPAGLELIMQRDKELVTQQSGVQPALQGVHANTSGKQYQIERDQSATTITDYVSAFNNFQLRVAKKQMWTIQWHYDSHRSVLITGDDIVQYYNPETMQDIDFDLALTLDSNSAVIREQLKDLVFQAYQRDELEFGQILDLADFGDTAKVKKAWEDYKARKQAAASAQAQQAAPGQSQLSASVENAAAATNGETQRRLQRQNGATHLLSAQDGASGTLAGTSGISS